MAGVVGRREFWRGDNRRRYRCALPPPAGV